MTLGKHSEWEDFGYTEEEIKSLAPAEWDAVQAVIKTHPDTIKAVEQLESIIKLVQQWTEGRLLATEATSEMKRILNEEEN